MAPSVVFPSLGTPSDILPAWQALGPDPTCGHGFVVGRSPRKAVHTVDEQVTVSASSPPAAAAAADEADSDSDSAVGAVAAPIAAVGVTGSDCVDDTVESWEDDTT